MGLLMLGTVTGLLGGSYASEFGWEGLSENMDEKSNLPLNSKKSLGVHFGVHPPSNLLLLEPSISLKWRFWFVVPPQTSPPK